MTDPPAGPPVAAPAPLRGPHGVLRIGIAGPLLGGHAGWVPSPGEVLARRWRAEGYDVRTTSGRIGRARRAVDTASTVRRWRGAVDVVVVLVYSGPAFAMAELTTAVARTSGLPVVHALHGGNLPQFAARHPRRTTALLRRSRAVVAPSGYLADAVRPLGFVTLVVPNVVEIERYRWRDHAPVAPRLLWMRTFHPLYDPALAVRALHRLRTHHPDASLTMAGQERGELDAVRALAVELGVGDATSFPGFVTDDDKPALFDRHDVFVNTNQVDNTPVSVLEAMAFGLPVVATAVGGIPYLVRHGETGLLTPPGDVVALAAAVERLVAEPALASELSRAGRAEAERCAWPAVGAQWREVLAAAVR